jgi:VCBS repeat protein/PKD domain-containing protein/FG-GAP repeat protein
MKLQSCRNLSLTACVLSGMVGLGGGHVAAQTAPAAPTVSLLRNGNLVQSVWPGDFNGDGITDLAATAPRLPGAGPSPVVITLGKGDGTFGAPKSTSFVGHVVGVTDINGDRRADLMVVEDPEPDVELFFALSNGDGTFTTTRNVNTFDSVAFALAADLNGDGIKDVIVGNGLTDVIQIYPGRADGTYTDIVTLNAGVFIHGAIVADVNGDGKKDLAVANHYSNSVTIFLNQGAFTFLTTDIPVGMQANGVATGDFNRDGKADLAVALSGGGDNDNYFSEGGTAVLLGNGDGTFGAPVTYDTPPGGWIAVTGDFNRDGITDIAVAGRSAIYVAGCGREWRTWDTLSILPGLGDGRFAAASNFSIGNQSDLDSPDDVNAVVSLNTSDLNGDHATDLIVSGGTVFLNKPADPNWAPTIDLSESFADSEAVFLRAKVADDDSDMVTYRWTSNDGSSIPPVPRWCVGSWATPGTHTYTLTVDDGHGHQASASVSFTVDSPPPPSGPTMTLLAPTEGSTITAGTPYTIKFHIDDPSMALYEWSIDYSLDNGATWAHIWECHDVGQSSGPGVPTSRDESCTWMNPGPEAAHAMLSLYAQDDADAPIGTQSVVHFTIGPQPGGVPFPWRHQDIGAVTKAGTTTFSNGVFTVSGSGADIWGSADEFQYAFLDSGATGNESNIAVAARVDSVQNVNAWTKAGVMIRAGVSAASPHASIFVTPGKGLAFQRRLTQGGPSYNTSIPGVTAPVYVRLVTDVQYPNEYVRAYYKKNAADPWTQFAQDAFPAVISQPLAGLAVSSHVDGTLAAAAFSGVSAAPAGPWSDASIGMTGGLMTTDGTQFTVKGIGADIWGTSDQFEFVYQPCSGDCTITARVTSLQNTNQWAKAGVMLRETLAAGSRQVDVIVSPSKGIAMQYRGATGGTSASAGTATGAAPGWVRLVRRGNVITGFWSTDGANYVPVGSLTMPMNPTIFAGLAVTSHNTTTATNAIFNPVTFEQP